MEYLLTPEQIMEHAKARAMMPEDWCKAQHAHTLREVAEWLDGECEGIDGGGERGPRKNCSECYDELMLAFNNGIMPGEATFSTPPGLADQARVTRTDGPAPDADLRAEIAQWRDEYLKLADYHSKRAANMTPTIVGNVAYCEGKTVVFNLVAKGLTEILRRHPAPCPGLSPAGTCDATDEMCVPYSRTGCFAGAPTDQPELHDTVEELAERAMEITTAGGEPDTMTNQYRVCSTRHLRDYPECHTECDHDVCISLPPVEDDRCYDETCISFDLCAANPTKTANCPNIVTEEPATVVPDTMTASDYNDSVRIVILEESLDHCMCTGHELIVEHAAARIMELNRPDPALLTDLAQLRDSYQEVGDRRPFNMQVSGSHETYRIVVGEITALLERHGVKE